MVLKRWRHPEPLEPWCYTPEEARRGVLEEPRIDLVDAVENGIVVYDNGFWERLRKEYYAQGPLEWRNVEGYRILVLSRRRSRDN